MIIVPRDHNSSVVCWRVRDGVIEVLVLDSTPNSEFEQDLQVKFPGGGSIDGETPEETARREFVEETELRIRKKTKLTLLYALPRDRHKRHIKYGFLVERSGCRGTLSKKSIQEGDSKIDNRRFVSIDEAIKIVHRHSRNLTQYYLAMYAKQTIEQIVLDRTPQLA